MSPAPQRNLVQKTHSCTWNSQNIEINLSASLDNAADIENIVRAVKRSMEDLNKIFVDTAPGMQLEWAERVRENWQGFYDETIPANMDELINSAHKIQEAVETARQIDKA